MLRSDLPKAAESNVVENVAKGSSRFNKVVF
jgi:hypothetical protein